MVCYIHYRRLSADTQQAHRSAFFALKNYTLVVDEVEARIQMNEQINTETIVDIDTILCKVVHAQKDERDLVKKSISK